MTGGLGLVVAGLAGAAWAVAGVDAAAGARRLAQLGLGAPAGLPGSEAGAAGPGGSAPSGPRPRAVALAAVALAAGVAVVVGGPPGVVAALLAGAGVWRLLRRLEPRAAVRHRERLAAQAPEAADLLAACLSSGAPLAEALSATAAALGAPVGEELARVVAQLHLGASPDQACALLLRHPSLAAVARTVVRSSLTGAPLAHALSRTADDLRARRRGELLAAARVAGVTAVLPLGLCFLPAFVLVGVVPVVVSLVLQLAL